MNPGHDTTTDALVSGVKRLLEHGGSRLHVEAPLASVLPSHAGALYLRVVNDTSEDDRLTRVASTYVRDAELHDVVREGEIVGMREATEGFVVPAHGVLTLARGGKHVMLFGIHDADGGLPVTMSFQHAGAITVVAPIRSAL